VTPPRPTALRLCTRLASARPPKPPLGLSAWSPIAEALAILVDATGIDVQDPRALANQIPHATEVTAAVPVFVLHHAAARAGLLGLLGAGRVSVPRLARCTALVTRGYVGVAAAVDEANGGDLVWGFSSPC
jgi:hypothetical protein